ncbi:MAG TPA: TonB family protein [Mesorhizobium sp.]|jgi:colicin import membrane protein|nr:TonB family protein [Mesorhizobium sp.]
MKAGFATSLVLHVAVLGWGLIALSAPAPLNAGDVEALPVDIVPIEELTQILEGDKTAAVSETPAPKPTAKPQTVPDAQEIGENDQDLKTPPTPEAKPREVKAAAEPPPSPEPAPKPAVEPLPEPAPAPKPEPKVEAAPAVEQTPEVQPKQTVEPEPAPETAVAEAAPEAEAVLLPDSAPAPQARPKPPEAQTAKAPEKKVQEPEKKVAEKPKSEAEKPTLEEEVAMLLNKEKASGGGAKRSTQQASHGGSKKTATSEKLSQGEMDALRGQLASCWNLPGAGGGEDLSGLRVSVRFNVDPSGKVDGQPSVESSSGNSIFDESALRAIRKCNSRGLILPKDKADVWSEIVVNFDPSEMLF